VQEVRETSGRARRGLVAVAVAAALSLSLGAASSVAQDPIYGESPGGGIAGVTGSGGGGGGGGASNAVLLKRCIAKAQTKFGDNRPKMKAAIKKCKKKYKRH
jgi:hypothetical protein